MYTIVKHRNETTTTVDIDGWPVDSRCHAQPHNEANTRAVYSVFLAAASVRGLMSSGIPEALQIAR
eukprot:m.132022 g.132022  ORF g.132022 m.132022 type:complete len:66 (-) comp29580_c0_seq3:1791-1988(-)